MTFLDHADTKIRKFDIRTVDGKGLIPELQRFSEEAEILDTDLNNSKQNALIRYLDTQINKLELCVAEEWNTGLPIESQEKESTWKFFKKEEVKLTYTCEEEGCSASYTNGQSFQRHLKKKHHLKRTVPMPTVTCRMKHISGGDVQIADHQMASHLKITHDCPKPSDSHYFRGFICNGGVFSPSFLLNTDPDPKDPSEIVNLAPDAPDAPDMANNDDSQEIPGNNVSNLLETPEKEMSSQSQSNNISPDFHGYSTTFKEVFAAKVSSSSHSDEIVAGEKDKHIEPGCSTSFAVPASSKDIVDMDDDGSDIDDPDFDFDPTLLSDFSDIEDDDSPDYTQHRIERRLYRYHMRREEPENNDLCKREGNMEIIEDFSKFVLGKNLSRNKKKSNIDKSVGHVAGYEDSLLEFLTKKQPDFTLSRLIAFKDKNIFVKLTDPLLDWIKDTAGESGLENASRQREKLKAHSDLRRYVIKKLKQTDFGNDLHDILWAQKIRDHINDISADINESDVWPTLNRVVEQERQKILIAKSLINPGHDQKECKALGVYLASKKFRDREISMNDLFLFHRDTNAWKGDQS